MGARRGKWIVGILAVAAAAVVAGAFWYFWPLIQFLSAFESLGRNVQGYPEYRHRSSGIVFVRLPGGTFEMGSPEGEEGRGLDETLHAVWLSPFLIAKTEVSQGQWRTVMGIRSASSSLTPQDTLPATRLPWDDLRSFLAKMNAGQAGNKMAHSRFELPTEAQWEYACRAGTTAPFSFGETVTPEQVNYDGNCPYGRGQTGLYRKRYVEVGSLPPNQFGLHEMHGNVWESCLDLYDGDFYRRAESCESNPCNRNGSGGQVCRGGSYVQKAATCRSALRLWFAPGEMGSMELGFRPAYYPLPVGL